MKGEDRCRYLLNTTQPLKFLTIDEIIDHLIINVNIIVNRVTKYFFIHTAIIAKSARFSFV